LTNKERVLDFLRSIAPNAATNEEIVSKTGVRPHQTVFQITRQLKDEGQLKAVQAGKEWRFWFAGSRIYASGAQKPPSTPDAESPIQENKITPRDFEKLATEAVGKHYGVKFAPGRVGDVPKIFDLVSADHRIVGDAKYFTLVGGSALPPAKFSIIAEHVWLLEKTDADVRILVFGNDREVPVRWLAKYGALVQQVSFFFLHASGALETLLLAGSKLP
jgi:hypothetical protein